MRAVPAYQDNDRASTRGPEREEPPALASHDSIAKLSAGYVGWNASPQYNLVAAKDGRRWGCAVPAYLKNEQARRRGALRESITRQTRGKQTGVDGALAKRGILRVVLITQSVINLAQFRQ